MTSTALQVYCIGAVRLIEKTLLSQKFGQGGKLTIYFRQIIMVDDDNSDFFL